ncbi:MAG: response regulator transcription factor [Myxococcota bacterium]
MARVLVVEDDEELGRQIVERLRKAGYEVSWWKEGHVVTADSIPDVDLVVLDLMLPGVAGLDVLKALRASSEVPVLVLSARNDTADKVRALRLGADDYMTKPFWPEELIERVRARLRRPALEREDVLVFEDLRVDVARRQVTRDGELVPLTRVELELLLSLVRRRGRAVTRAWLAQQVLDNEGETGARALDAHVSRLRKKLEVTGLIETVWGIGYRFVGSAP